MDLEGRAEDGRAYSIPHKLVSTLAIALLLFGGGWATYAPGLRPLWGIARTGQELGPLARLLEPKEVAAQEPARTAAAAASIVLGAGRLGIGFQEAFSATFPDARHILGMLALDRDIDDFRDNAEAPGAVGSYYREEARIALDMRPLRRNYEAAFASACEILAQARGGAAAPSIPERRARPSIGAPEELWLPARSELALSHPYALDIFFRRVDRVGEAEKGPAIRALYPGVVVASAGDWSGGQGAKNYKGGGLSPSSGNGLVIYDPASRRYCSYFHLSSVAFAPGSIVAAGQVLGRGGNTGMNARKAGHGDHVHVEIYDAAGDRPLSAYEILDVLEN